MNPTEKRETNLGDWQGQSLGAAEQNSISNLKTTLSRKLTDAANALREKSHAWSGTRREIAEYGDQAAGWLDRSADYIAELDAQQVKRDLESQVRNHPGRSLLIATAAGLVIGTLIRRR